MLIELLLIVTTMALVVLAGAAWAIYGVLVRGFDQQIKALQAIYEQEDREHPADSRHHELEAK